MEQEEFWRLVESMGGSERELRSWMGASLGLGVFRRVSLGVSLGPALVVGAWPFRHGSWGVLQVRVKRPARHRPRLLRALAKRGLADRPSGGARRRARPTWRVASSPRSSWRRPRASAGSFRPTTSTRRGACISSSLTRRPQ